MVILPVAVLSACAPSHVPTSMGPLPVTMPGEQKPQIETKPVEVLTPAPKPPSPNSTVKISEPARLKGLTPLQVREVLGQPGFLRRDAPAEIWQYRGRGCTLDLFIYDLGNGQAVDHWAVRSPARVNDSECFQQLVDQGHPQPGS